MAFVVSKTCFNTSFCIQIRSQRRILSSNQLFAEFIFVYKGYLLSNR